jgi:site-specific DNA-methyltransferase (adenine-specific)
MQTDVRHRARVAIQQGRDLLILKSLIRGTFKRLVADRLPFSYSTATDYMKLARADEERLAGKVGRRNAQPSGSMRKALARIEYRPRPLPRKALEKFHGIIDGLANQHTALRREMMPTTTGNWYEIHHGDCLDLMTRIPDHSVDMILADLPFGSASLEWDIPIDLPRFWRNVCRIIRPSCPIIMFADLPFAIDLINSNRSWYKYDLAWVTNHSTGFPHSKVRPLRRHHTVLIFSNGTAISPERSSRSIRYYPETEPIPVSEKRVKQFARQTKAAGYNHASGLHVQHDTGYPKTVLHYPIDRLGFHPTEKPIALLQYLIELYTRSGDVVLDPTMGAGSTGTACGLSGRRFIGIEKEREFFDRAAALLADCSRRNR